MQVTQILNEQPNDITSKANNILDKYHTDVSDKILPKFLRANVMQLDLRKNFALLQMFTFCIQEMSSIYAVLCRCSNT